MLLEFSAKRRNWMEPLKSNGSIAQGNLENWAYPLEGNGNPGSKY